MDLVIAWSVIAFAALASALALKNGLEARSPSAAIRVVGTGCGTFVLGVVVTSWMLLAAFQRLAVVDDPDAKVRVLERWIARVSPPGYLAMAVGIVTICIGAWLRASARDTSTSSKRA